VESPEPTRGNAPLENPATHVKRIGVNMNESLEKRDSVDPLINATELVTLCLAQHPHLEAALDRQAKLIEKNLQLVVKPIEDKLKEHHLSLYGEGGNNGLTGNVKGLSLKVKLLIIVLGALFTAGITLVAALVGAYITSSFPGLK